MRNKSFAVMTALILVFALVCMACSSQTPSDESETKSETQNNTVETNNDNAGVDTPDAQTDTNPAASDVSDVTDKDENANPSVDNKDNAADAGDDSSTAAGVWSGELNITADTDDAVKEEGNTYYLTAGGEYHVRGNCVNRQIVVDAPEADLDIHLEGVTMTSDCSPLIFVENAEEVTISATEGSNNKLSDTRSARVDKNDDSDNGNAAIYSKDDLKFKGRGRLTVEASYNNGIGCKNDIKIKNITLIVNAYNNGIKGNDSVTVESGNITIEAQNGSGIKTKNTHISDKGNQKGYITISGGTVNITSADEALDAALDVIIDEANATVTTNK